MSWPRGRRASSSAGLCSTSTTRGTRTRVSGRDAETGRSCARLHVRVVQARSLPQMRRHRGSCDPYVEVAVDGASPKKTGTVYDSLYPTWARERFELRVNRKTAVLRCRVLDAPPARGRAAAARRDVQPRPPGPGRAFKNALAAFDAGAVGGQDLCGNQAVS